MQLVSYKCPDCDSTHLGRPALNLRFPEPVIDAMQRGDRVKTGPSICQILYPKPKRHFIKANFAIPIHEGGQLDYGGWIELEEEDLRIYENFRQWMGSKRISGILTSKIPGFEDAYGTPVIVTITDEDTYPHLHPLNIDTRLYKDLTNGVSNHEAELRMKSWILAVNQR
ncbi:hypothetical protein CDES_04585 [Corynebacterium deserti GIMN1.010]|uniref:DUF2199 domain-containing protein n=1 Tax=Corynebacterium deserti GIMN1.010 TaxID=931089 RepID=A0A0M4CW90_9CORY|nr:DUF2199 domain-containing protein [Corynebacterium deserti]ALC05362.1 hypothetical protein CDES_04585 [Corynebacterium deserti GIMN1.010]